MMKIYGITGGVGCGKSAVLEYLSKKHKAYVVQADEVGHELMKKGGKAYEKLYELIGDSLLDKDGEIDKGYLASLIFSSKNKQIAVNSIVHPLVKDRIIDMINQRFIAGDCEVFVMEAALLLEARYDVLCDEVWYVYADEEVRRERLKRTRGYSDEKIDSIMKSQLPEDVFRERCDFVLDNSGTLEELYAKIDSRLVMKNA
jgi:dephospho-CoA kinase